MIRVLASLLVFVALSTHAAEKVIAIADGDTGRVFDLKKNEIKVRLAGIDAPEKRQAFSEKGLSQSALVRYVPVGNS